MRYTIGTRSSRLSIAQTNWVIAQLQRTNPDNEYVIKTITTQGDTDSRPLFTINQKGIFEREIDRAVSQGEVDFAVHSLKDIPSVLEKSLTVASIPRRELPNDILISVHGTTLDSMPKGSTIGTSSLRRAVQITQQRSDLKVQPLRGNIDTRVKKMVAGTYDGIVLARAGVMRLGLDVNYYTLDVNEFVPSPGQGALGIVARTDDQETITMLQSIEDHESRIAITAERAISEFIDSGCRFPLGAYATIRDDSLSLHVSAFSVDGSKSLSVKRVGKIKYPDMLGRSTGKYLVDMGINDLAANWRNGVEAWNKS